MADLRITIISRMRLAGEGISKLLSADDRFTTCSHHGSIEAALKSIVQKGSDVVVIDIDETKDFSAISTLRASSEKLAVVISGIPLSRDTIIPCAKAGASGYIRCDASVDEWADAICAAADGRIVDGEIGGILNEYISNNIDRDERPAAQPLHSDSWRVPVQIDESAKRVGLTARERQILALVDQGLSTKSIAKKLGRSPATIKSHIQAVLAKYNVHRRSEAAAIFRRTKDITDKRVDQPTQQKN